MEEELLKFGLLEQIEPVAKDWRMGGVSGASKEVLRKDGNYTKFLPSLEIQRGVYGDTMACVTFSALNCLETIANLMGMPWNKSDRFTAKMSGTTKSGNYLRLVAESIRKHGVVDEEVWPYPREQRRPVFDWDQYYAEIPSNVIGEGARWAWKELVQWEWVGVQDLREALVYGPIQVTVRAWPKPQENGLYTDGGIKDRNHAVMLFNATDEYYEIFDHYEKSIKRLVPDYRFGSALQYSFVKKVPMNTTLPMLPDNALVQDVEGSGAFGMSLNGKIMIGPTADILATVIMRSESGSEDSLLLKRIPLAKAVWDAFPKVDTKNNPLS